MKAFLHPQTSFGDMDAGSAATLVAAAADITLVVDEAGVIRDIAFSNDELAAELAESANWLGRPLATVVVEDSRAKAHALIDEAHTQLAPKWRHLNHAIAGGASIPVQYCAVPLSNQGRVLVFGRDLRAISALQQRLMNAQQSMERDYSRLRDVEMRYRLLFQMSSEAVLVLDAARQRIVEANPAARLLLDVKDEAVLGHGLGDVFEPDSLGAVHVLLNTVRSGGRADSITVRLAAGGAEATVAASMFRQDNAALFLVRIAHAGAPGKALAVLPDPKSKLLKAVENAPDGFVVTDDAGRIITANASFLEMVQLPSEDLAIGEPLDRWLGQSSVDLNVLVANLRQRGSVRFFSTSVRGEYGVSAEVEVSAVSVANGGQPSYGFAIRNVGPRLRVETRAGRELPRSVEQLSELIGRVSLKDLVREATDVIERMCIEAALELTDDNRASAAEMLGLSRQSFYVKLRRYGLGDLAADGKN